jgi:hypothetical protein
VKTIFIRQLHLIALTYRIASLSVFSLLMSKSVSKNNLNN